MQQPFVELKNVSKIFPGVIAMNKINLTVYPGEILGLVGENGAGKSTLVKVLTGAHQQDEGKIFIDGREVNINDSHQSMELGISAIYQELNIVPKLSVAENVFLGRELKSPGGFVKLGEMRRKAGELLKELGQDIDPSTIVERLGMGRKQMVEIAKALSIRTRLLIMDEPTSSLSGKEVKDLLNTVLRLKEKGISVIFISHRLNEVFEICDRITVLRDGELIKTLDRKDATEDEVVRLMIGRELTQQYPKVKAQIGDEIFRVENFTREGVFKDVRFSAHEGEVLGISGLVGAGRTEVARAIFGADHKDSGTVYVKGEKVTIRSPRDAMKYGIAFLTEDRKTQGLVLINTVGFNMSLPIFERCRKGLFIDRKDLKNRVRKTISKLNINPPTEKFIVRQLSGGNQQKVVIGKWLQTNADIFIFDEPTRGLDVAAKTEVYDIINDLVKNGKSVIMISSEMPEILGMSDRIIVMHEGRVTGEFNREDACQENIMKAASGGI